MTKEERIRNILDDIHDKRIVIGTQLMEIGKLLDYPKEDITHEIERSDLIVACELGLEEYIPRFVELTKFAQVHLQYSYQAHKNVKPYILKHIDRLTTAELEELKGLLE